MAYGASGAAALIYEVTWTRLLALHLGHSIAAASTVLAAFMGGLAIGSAVGGRIGGKLTPAGALRTYAGLDAAIAILALLVPLELAALHPLLVIAYADGSPGVTFTLLRVASSLFLLALPAAAMGATFPIASRWMIPGATRAAVNVGRLYTVNTIGAALGAVLAGFVLLPSFGFRDTTLVGVALNLCSAGVAWLIAGRGETADASAARRSATMTKRSRSGSSSGLGLRWVAAVALGLSGFASLTLQVVWTRLLAMILGPTTYAFSIIVAVFIAGLACGAAIASPLAARSRHPLFGLAVCLLLSVGLAAAAVASVDGALLVMAETVAAPDADFGTVLSRQVLLVASLLVPMTVAFGATFPFAVAVGTRSDDTLVADLGLIYAVNTAGAIAGAVLAGFLLIPNLGLHDTVRVVLVVVAAGTLLLLLVRWPGYRGVAGVFACGLVLLAGIALPSWDQALLSSGAYKYAYEAGPHLKTSLAAGRLLYYREGALATVAVRDLVGGRSLSIDGKIDASNRGDMLTQRLLAHLPLLLHPEPRRVAVLGLGSGVTLGSALTHPVERVDVLEISPEVVEASQFFEAENHRALANPRTRLIVGDGRSHLMLSRSDYDVIISEPSNPWMAGIASLFTREFFESARARLTPGGIFCQWAHTYDMSDADLRSIVATFLSVFPEGTLWLIGEGDVLLIGSTEPFGTRFSEMEHQFTRPGVARDLADVGIREPFPLFSLFVAEGEPLVRYAAGAAIQTDDRLGLEFSGPRSIFGRQASHNDDVLTEVARTAPSPPSVRAAIEQAGPTSWRDRGWMLLRAELHEPAWRDFVRALESDPTDAQTYEGLIRAAVGTIRMSRMDETLVLLRRLAEDPAHLHAGLALSRLLAMQGTLDEAAAQAIELIQRHPGNVDVLDQLAAVLSDAGDIERLQPVVAEMRTRAPTGEATRFRSAELLFMQGEPDLAVHEAEAVLRLNPQHALALNVLGAALAANGVRDRARESFEASLRADPSRPVTYTNLAMLERESGNLRAAAQRYAEALTLNPSSEIASRGLAEVTALSDP